MGKLIEVSGVTFEQRAKAPGKAVVLKTKAAFVERTTELYHPPGISSAPIEKDIGAEIELGNVRLIIATHNYRIEVEPNAGEIIIYSTDSTGATVMSQLKLDNDGHIDLNGSSKTFVTHTELNTALQSFITALNLHTHPTAAPGPVSPPSAPMSLDISGAATTTIRTGG